ncbi:MAG: arylsulfatase [Tenacibaculum sp.]
MNKINGFLLYFNVILLVFIVVFNSSCTNKQAVSYKKKPNIIYILADDLGYGDIGAYGQVKIETPNIDALAKEGMLFTQHYSGAPVCAPARASLLTGKHGGHSAIRGNDEWKERGDVWSYHKMLKDSTLEGQRPLEDNTPTIASLLKQEGYTTALIGKWGLGAPHTNSIPTKMGFDYFFGYNCQRMAHSHTPVFLYENEKRFYLKNDTVATHTGIEQGADPYASESYQKFNQPNYAPSLNFDKMINFIKQNKNQSFFLYWASPIPHLPLQAPKKWVNYYLKKFGDEKPYYFTGKGSYFPIRYPRASYAAMVSYLDQNIGKLVAYLKSTGLYKNTLLIFTSDNGPAYNIGGADSQWFNSASAFSSANNKLKGSLYEGGIRVPMIATWPAKIKAGTVTNHLSAFYDVMPTLNEIAGVKGKYKSDGISFYNTLSGVAKQKEHKYLYWEFSGYKGQVAVRMGKWKMIWDNIKKGNKQVKLFNLENDVKEENNIAYEHPEIVKEFFKIVKKEHKTPNNKTFIIKPLEDL